MGPCYSCEVVGQSDAGRGLVGLACPVCMYIYVYIYFIYIYICMHTQEYFTH